MRVLYVLIALIVMAGVSLDTLAAGRGAAGRPSARTAAVLDHYNTVGGAGDDDECDDGIAEFFESDPRLAPNAVVAGEALDRLTWSADDPAFPGDRPGSLSARYDATMPAGLFGFALPCPFDEETIFTAAAAFIVDSEEFSADPFGFFQVSWGLWNSETTGLNRTGDDNGGADTYELLELDYFPNVSPFFGGPFLTGTAFGTENGGNGFNNFVARFDLSVELPLDTPLIAVLEHRPDLNALVAQVLQVHSEGGLLPLTGAVVVVSLDQLSIREYGLDTVGLTLWNDAFTGDTPSVLADVEYHALIARPGPAGHIEDWFGLEPGDDDEDED